MQLEAPSFLMPLDKSRAYGGGPMTARGSNAAENDRGGNGMCQFDMMVSNNSEGLFIYPSAATITP